jgi:uncharacterized protein (DUF4213/DUF364 family)
LSRKRRRILSILQETAELVREYLGERLASLRIERLVVGLFFTGVKLSNNAAGMCATPIKEIPQAVCCPASAGRTFDPVRIKGTEAEAILPFLDSTEPIKTATAIAVLNALSATCLESGPTGDYTVTEGIDAQDAVKMPPEKSVAVIGAFVPTLRALKRRGGDWWVIEKDPRTLRDDEISHFVPADESQSIINTADVLIITGTTLINHTLEPILEAAKPGAEIAVMGPTASLLPEPLFQRGVRIVGGVRVKKPDQLLDVLTAGGSGHHFFDESATRIVLDQGLSIRRAAMVVPFT